MRCLSYSGVVVFVLRHAASSSEHAAEEGGMFSPFSLLWGVGELFSMVYVLSIYRRLQG